MAKNDSAFGTKGIATRTKNPGNMRCVADLFSPHGAECIESPGNGHFQSFASLEDGVRQNVSLYIRRYAGRTPDETTRIWAGNPQSQGYWKDIRECYPAVL